MADAFDATEKLITRATAAIAEAKRLADENRSLQEAANARLRRIYFRATFYPKSLRFYRPLDFLEKKPSYQPFLFEYEDPLSLDLRGPGG